MCLFYLHITVLYSTVFLIIRLDVARKVAAICCLRCCSNTKFDSTPQLGLACIRDVLEDCISFFSHQYTTYLSLLPETGKSKLLSGRFPHVCLHRQGSRLWSLHTTQTATKSQKKLASEWIFNQDKQHHIWSSNIRRRCDCWIGKQWLAAGQYQNGTSHFSFHSYQLLVKKIM